MDKFALTKEEAAVLNTAAAALRALPEASQYKVLRNLAHFMNREVVGIGAVRAAAAVAGSVARAQVSEKPEAPKRSKTAKRGKAPKGGYPPEFLALPAVTALVLDKETAKAGLSDPPTEDQTARLRNASKALRDAYQRFRSST